MCVFVHVRACKRAFVKRMAHRLRGWTPVGGEASLLATFHFTLHFCCLHCRARGRPPLPIVSKVQAVGRGEGECSARARRGIVPVLSPVRIWAVLATLRAESTHRAAVRRTRSRAWHAHQAAAVANSPANAVDLAGRVRVLAKIEWHERLAMRMRPAVKHALECMRHTACRRARGRNPFVNSDKVRQMWAQMLTAQRDGHPRT